jgi:lactaldehyde reductase
MDALTHAIEGYIAKGAREITDMMYLRAIELISKHLRGAVNAVQQLSLDVGIPRDLKEIVKEGDVPFLAESAMADACRPGNPKDPSLDEVKALYLKLL